MCFLVLIFTDIKVCGFSIHIKHIQIKTRSSLVHLQFLNPNGNYLPTNNNHGQQIKSTTVEDLMWGLCMYWTSYWPITFQFHLSLHKINLCQVQSSQFCCNLPRIKSSSSLADIRLLFDVILLRRTQENRHFITFFPFWINKYYIYFRVVCNCGETWVVTWQRMKAWKRDDMWSTDAWNTPRRHGNTPRCHAHSTVMATHHIGNKPQCHVNVNTPYHYCNTPHHHGNTTHHHGNTHHTVRATHHIVMATHNIVMATHT